MTQIELALLLISMVIVITIVSRRLGASTPIAMVLGGLLLSFTPGVPQVELSPEVVFFGFLPPLIFSGGYSTSLREFKSNLRPIALLAFGLVLFTIVVVAVVVRAFIPTLEWPAAFALGAIIAPPDEIAALAIFQRLGVPRRIVTILEGESLLNDATALIAYRFAIAAAAAGVFSLLEASAQFVIALVGGFAVGMVVGFAMDKVAARVRDTPTAVAMTLIAPYACYLPAEALGVSGVLAAVVGGIWMRHATQHTTSDTRVVSAAVWQTWLFLLNGIVFFLLGLQLPEVIRNVEINNITVGAALAVVIAAIVARFTWVFPATYLPRLIPAVKSRDPNPPKRAVAVIAWAGLRGVVSLAAALALPQFFPDRDLIVFITFVVIIATLVGQGLTLPMLIRVLGLAPQEDTAHQETHARALTAEAALRRIDDLEEEFPGHKPLIDTLRSQYEHRTSHAEDHDEKEPGEAEEELIAHTQIKRELIEAERRAAFDLRERAVIDDEILRRIERDLDLEELRMEN